MVQDVSQVCRDVILDSINEGVFTVDRSWRILSFNRAAERITGVAREEAIGRPCSEVFRASICEVACALRQTLETGEPVVNAAVYIINADGDRIPIKISTALLRDAEGEVIGGVETFQDLTQVQELLKRLEGSYTFADIIGRSPAMLELFTLLPQVAGSDSNVLVSGASGTGKELVARALHNLSPRKEEKFVAVNCGALPDNLLESELFGHKAGAFTGAVHDRAGRFAIADGGTLFLDEIGDISAAMQVRLLRVLQEGVFEPLGSVESVQVDLRIVSATNKDLEALVRDGVFREDLYYRIHVVHLELPDLKDRPGDVPLLADHFIGEFNRVQSKDVTALSDEVLSMLMTHDFPGNVRELRNIVEHAFVLCDSGLIQQRHLPLYLQKAVGAGSPPADPVSDLKSAEKQMIANALLRHHGNRRAVSTELGINPSTLYRKIKAFGIVVPDTDGRRRVLS
ncbi:MAG: sigma 54-interacting transcriptional regulator [Lentisphaeria bacterium]|nr:sigma 54-interacting transcriptional regulator [Lentisphaeria bacterium]